MRVLAVDPGGVTGLALWDPQMFAPHHGPNGYEPFGSWQVEGYEGAVRSLWDEVTCAPDALVCEGFVIRSNTHKLDSGAFSHTTDLIGACRYLAHEHGVPFYRQTPAEAKAFASDEKLRRLGWYNATPGGHANDAARHLLTFLVKQGETEILERLA